MNKIFALSLILLSCAVAHAAAPKGVITPEKQLESAARINSAGGAQLAIDAGATNVSAVLNEKLRVINPLKFGAKPVTVADIELLKVLIDNSGELLDAKIAERFITQAISYNCTNGEKPLFNVRDIIGISAWDYDANSVMDAVAQIAAENDDKPAVVQCVFTQVGASKLAGPEFLDRAQRVANDRNSPNMAEFINVLRGEIAKQQADKK